MVCVVSENDTVLRLKLTNSIGVWASFPQRSKVILRKEARSVRRIIKCHFGSRVTRRGNQEFHKTSKAHHQARIHPGREGSYRTGRFSPRGTDLSPRHIPAKIIPVADIPYTINGKKVELAVRNIIHNEPVLNVDALANPESLEYYKNIKELQS